MLRALKPVAKAVFTVSQRLTGPRVADHEDLARIRRAMLERVMDCERQSVRRVHQQLDGAGTALQLWLLRSEVFQVVSEAFGQAEAAQRVATLAPLFRGLLPRKQLRQG